MTSHADSEPVEQITVDLGQRSYDILIGPGLIDSAGAQISSRLNTPRAFIITDANVAPLLGDRLEQVPPVVAGPGIPPGCCSPWGAPSPGRPPPKLPTRQS